MKENFAFYGTLKNLDTLEGKFGIETIECMTGQVRGCLYEVQDSTEPTGTYVYPLLDTEGSGTVNAVLVVLDIDETERQKIINTISEYEGPLFKAIQVDFYTQSSDVISAYVFGWDKKAVLPSAIISKMKPNTDNKYTW